jgi:hypothetical protein
MGWFLVVVVGCCAMFGLALSVVDPRGDFDTGMSPVVVRDSRRAKMKLFVAFNARTPVEGIILGSSRSMKISPRVLTAATGLTFFNFSVESARTEDYLAIYRWVRAHDARPRAVVIGLDVEALHDRDTPDDRLQRNAALRNLVDAPDSALWSLLSASKSMFTIAYVKDASRSVWQALRGSERPLSGFDADGYLRYFQWESQRAQGVPVFEDNLERCLRLYLARFEDMHGLSTTRKRHLESALLEARADGARAVAWVTPLHPVTTGFLEQRTRYGALLALTRAYLAELHVKLGIPVHDFSAPAGYGGTGAGWYDCAHADDAEADLIAHAVARDLHGL